MNRNEVNEAFEILLEEIEAVANSLNKDGVEALGSGDYNKARLAIDEAERLAEFREKAKALQTEWTRLFAQQARGRRKSPRRKAARRLPRGLRTREEAFRRPMLETLMELGGAARMGEVLDHLEQRMKGILNEYDYQTLPSDPRSVRWRNTAQWCRYTLVREGLMNSDSPSGVWEISAEGRGMLQSPDDTT